MSSRDIVVGTDGSSPAQAAVAWAAEEAARRGASLRILTAFDWPWLDAPFQVDPPRGPAEALVASAIADTLKTHPGLTVTGAAIDGDPVSVLLSGAAPTDLLVVGNRGRGGFGSLLLGSVSQRVATHATGPVAVVRGGRHDEGPVVVGVDGSASSPDALALAYEYAVVHERPLVAIRAYRVPEPPWGADSEPLTIDPQALHTTEHQVLEQILTPWRAKYPDVPTTVLATPGGPADVLVTISAKACLVVVGSRGHGELAGTLLGSVGLALLHHAECPVLVAHHRPGS